MWPEKLGRSVSTKHRFYCIFNDYLLTVAFTFQRVDVRFIEYMPFDGNKWNSHKMVTYQEMIDEISQRWPGFHRLQDGPNDTSKVHAAT